MIREEKCSKFCWSRSFEIELKLSNGRNLIVMKHSLVTVSFT